MFTRLERLEHALTSAQQQMHIDQIEASRQRSKLRSRCGDWS
jgi:hypothetical protein